jgi:hypothetical protein
MRKKVAIIGGGIAGVYTAWRLMHSEQADQFEVTLFESTDRMGGRIHSQLIPPLEFRAELGAMRFHPTHHLLRALIADLNIPIRPFDVPAPHLRVRGRTLTATEVLSGGCTRCGAGVPFLLRSSERERSADQLVHEALQMLFRDLSFPNAKVEQARFHKEALLAGSYSEALWTFVREYGMYENVPLRDIGFWNLLQHYLSNEAFSLVHTAMSLESVIGNWNAAEAIPWFMADYSGGDLWMVPGGMSRVIDRMIRELRDSIEKPDSDSAWLRKRSTVRQCRRMVGGQWMIETADRAEENGEPKEFDNGPFDEIVFATPLEALKEIEILDGDAELELNWLKDVEGHRLFKVFLLFQNPWWVSSGVPAGTTGRTYTDLPLRQVYYFHPDWMGGCVKGACEETDGKDEEKKFKPWDDFSDKPAWEEFVKSWPEVQKKLAAQKSGPQWSLVMASYSDEHHVNFWRPATAAARSQSSAIHYNNPEGLEAKDARLLRNAIDLIPDRLRIRTRTVQKILQQLREIHGQAVPEPVAGIYMDWNEPPFRAGWHTWIVGTDPDSHSQKIANFGHGLHFCGEAWSRDQGWIEGALKTAERVLAGSPFKAKPTKTAKLYVDMNFATYIGGNDTHEDGVKPAEATP